ncbi:hypothetical protein A0H81_05672 [Grifola frondosa]|uniref:Uncharacterized protein n=1 Tax=Grifola frondosa TaxID=5627 RepID=A0A1C7MCL5_GRIFR|nr:hypothetical protein A0H81_05672 [Grifola frondosa]
MHLHSWSSLTQLLEVLVGTSVEHLHLDITHSGRTQPISINDHRHISVLAHLRAIELVVSWADYASVYGFLSLVPHIREVTLCTCHMGPETYPSHRSCPRIEALNVLRDSSLDQLFSGSQTSQLQRLTMTFRDVTESRYFWTRAVSSRLPRARARGILHVEIDDLSSSTHIWPIRNYTSSLPAKKQCLNSTPHSSKFIMLGHFHPESGFVPTS